MTEIKERSRNTDKKEKVVYKLVDTGTGIDITVNIRHEEYDSIDKIVTVIECMIRSLIDSIITLSDKLFSKIDIKDWKSEQESCSNLKDIQFISLFLKTYTKSDDRTREQLRKDISSVLSGR